MTGPGHGRRREGRAATTVRAAGCVLWRLPEGGGQREFCLVHRPKYDDWSHPKGKLKRGEDALTAALREVAEETGRACRTGVRLPTVRYLAHGGRPKVVDYWVAEETGGAFEPSTEVDEIRWLPVPGAARLLTADRDRALLSEAVRGLDRARAGE